MRLRAPNVRTLSAARGNKRLTCFLKRVIFCGWLAGWLLGGCVLSPSFTALDLAGKPVDPFAEKNAAATVLIFVSNDCPIANRYIPEMRRLRNTYAARGVNFWMVHADPAETPAAIRDHDRQFDLTIPALRDPQHFLVKLARAEVTPSAAVFTRDGALAYHGRIDDRVAGLERERLEPVRRDLAEALDAVLSGRPVAVSVTPAIGCYIPAPR